MSKNAFRFVVMRMIQIAFMGSVWGVAHGWLVDHDFENIPVGANCGLGASGGSVVSDQVASEGRRSCRFSIRAGETGFGEWGGIVGIPENLRAGDEIWIRLKTYMPVEFNYDSIGAGNRLKFIRVHTRSSGTANEGYDDWYINPEGSAEPFRFIFEGEQEWSRVGNRNDAIVRGRWETYELYLRLHPVPVDRGGLARVRMWKNGRLLADITDRQTLRSAQSYADNVLIFTYWNGGAPRTQHMFIDQLTVTSTPPKARDAAGNAFIGLGPVGESVAPPLAPTALTAK